MPFVAMGRPLASGRVSMESIRIVCANSIQEAKQQARVVGKKNEHPYVNMDGNEIGWAFAGFKAFEILETDEIGSRDLLSAF